MIDLSSNDVRAATATTMALNTFIVGSKVLINDSRLE
jgi:hypothetical protein